MILVWSRVLQLIIYQFFKSYFWFTGWKFLLFNTELPKYYAWLQMAVTRGLGLTAGRLAGHLTDTAPKHSLLFQFSFRVDGHAHRRTFAKQKC